MNPISVVLFAASKKENGLEVVFFQLNFRELQYFSKILKIKLLVFPEVYISLFYLIKEALLFRLR